VQEAAGYIVYVLEAGQRRFLLLRNARHGTWGFPKGRLEKREDARTGALRELREETGIERIDADPAFETQSVYDLPAGGDDDPVRKRVVYFLGRVPERSFRRSREHDAADWMTAEEALAALQHADTRRVLREALARLRRAEASRA
jgi:8-oxo-dGTP pyrophosphatase MutT (NUDIX family)